MTTPPTNPSAWRVEPFEPERGSRADFAELTALWNAARALRMPDDPPREPAFTRKDLESLRHHESVDFRVYLVRDGARIVGTAIAELPLKENLHALFISIEVHPDQRRRGIGTRLLAEVVAHARREERRLLLGWTLASDPSGAAFATRVGAEAGLEGHVNQLVLGRVDRAMLARWIERGEGESEFELLFRSPPFPEAELEEICRTIEVMNTEPRGSLDTEDFAVTPERLREGEASLAARGDESWAMFVRHVPSGEFAGYTQIGWHPTEAFKINQWGTAVKPAFRGHGLGKWLKAAMLDKVMRELPQARVVRTGNADSNAPMLAINHALGFEPYTAETSWQVELSRVEGFVRARGR